LAAVLLLYCAASLIDWLSETAKEDVTDPVSVALLAATIKSAGYDCGGRLCRKNIG
jgi:hypothetical protein